MSRRRVLFVGFDAMDPDLTRRLAAAGQAPAFHELLRTSSWAPTTNPPGLVVGGVWPSIWSGVWPSRHGYYCSWQLVNGTYDQRRTSPNDIDRAPFWAPVAEAGRRVFVLDVPLTPLHDYPGCSHVVDWGTHDRPLDPASVPPSLLQEIQREIGPYPLRHECDVYATRGARQELRDGLVAGAELRDPGDTTPVGTSRPRSRRHRLQREPLRRTQPLDRRRSPRVGRPGRSEQSPASC